VFSETETATLSPETLWRRMLAEMERSQTQLKMDNLAAPYYVEYHVAEVDEFDAEAAFGALRLNQRTHGRSLRVVVRVGDYKQDGFGPGGGQVSRTVRRWTTTRWRCGAHCGWQRIAPTRRLPKRWRARKLRRASLAAIRDSMTSLTRSPCNRWGR
jgi:hypothetical protein